MKGSSLGILIVVISIIIGAGFYLNTQQIQPGVNNQTLSQNTSPTVMEQALAPVKEFSMTAKKFEFDPPTITVKQGDKVRLKVKSIDVEHGFSLPDFDIKVNLAPNKEEIIEFTADKKGTFTFFCSVFCGEGHRSMKGSLIVE